MVKLYLSRDSHQELHLSYKQSVSSSSVLLAPTNVPNRGAYFILSDFNFVIQLVAFLIW